MAIAQHLQENTGKHEVNLHLEVPDHNHPDVGDDNAIHDELPASLPARDQIFQLPQEHRQNK